VPFWNEIGVPQGIIALGIGIDPFTVIFAVLLFGFLAERYPIRFMAIIGGSWRAMSMLPLIFLSTHSFSVLLHNFIWGVGSGALAITQTLIIPTYFGRYSQGSIGGIILPLMIMAGAAGAPTLGYLVDNGFSIITVWKAGMVLMFGSGLVVFFIKPPKLKT
jgi:predicted MFS family arabinose efflux permease